MNSPYFFTAVVAVGFGAFGVIVGAVAQRRGRWLAACIVLIATTVILVAAGTLAYLLRSSLTAVGQENRKRATAKVQMISIATAVTNWLHSSPSAPLLKPAAKDLVFAPDSQAALMDILSGVDRSNNFAGTVFLLVPNGTLVGNRLCDPWGNPYGVGIDSNRDGVCEIENVGKFSRSRVVVWTTGDLVHQLP